VVVVTLAAGFLGILAGRGASTGWLVAAVFSGQLAIGWANDYVDRDLDRRLKRTDKPIAAGLLPPTAVRTAAIIAAAACIPLSLANGLAAGGVHIVAVAIGIAYDLGLKRTVASVVPYFLAFGSLPAFVTLGLHPAHLPPAWLTLGAALLGSGGHFTQVIPDIEEERRLGIGGLPQLLGVRASIVAAAVLLGGAALLVLLGPGQPGQLQLVLLAVTLGLVVGVVVTGLRGRHRLSFRLTLVAAAGVALILLGNGRALGQ